MTARRHQRRHAGILLAACLPASLALALVALTSAASAADPPKPTYKIGREAAVPDHLKDGDEFNLPVGQLLDFGRKLFMANWTEQDGGGRPLSKGTGKALSDP